MWCEVCGRKSATQSLEIRQDDGLKHWQLCDTCAQALQDARQGHGPESDPSDLTPEAHGHTAHEAPKICAHCHTTARQFAETGKPGCPDCYSLFSREISVLLMEQQNHMRHFGKRRPGARRGRIA